MPQQAVLGPLGELHLGNQLRLRPRDAPGLRPGRRIAKRRGRPLQLAESLPLLRQRLLREARAHASTVRPLVSLAVAHQQGTELGAGSFGSGEPADDELLSALALRFQPAPRATGLVGAVDTFRDDSLERMAARVLQHLRT